MKLTHAEATFALIVFMTATTVGCFPHVFYPRAKVSEYQGEGSIARVRHTPGFRIDFEQFSLARPYKADYRLLGLPDIRDGYEVGLVAVVPLSEKGKRPSFLTGGVGKLHLRLKSSTGVPIFDCSSTLNEMSWTWMFGEAHGVIDSAEGSWKNSAFFAGQFAGFLEVNYEPLPGAPEIMAKIRIWAGVVE